MRVKHIQLLFAIVAAGLAVTGAYAHLVSSDARSWPSTIGKVLGKHVVGFGAGLSAEAGASDTYTANIIYEYQVDGKSYSGMKVRVLDLSFGSRNEAEKYVGRFVVGEQVAVYYKPQSPQQAVLDIEYPQTAILLLLMGAIFSVGIGACLPYVLRILKNMPLT